MKTLKEALLWMVNTADKEDLRVVTVVAGALVKDLRVDTMLDVLHQAGNIVKGAKDLKDPNGGSKKPRTVTQPPNKAAPRSPESPGVRVIEALKQTTGKIGAGELAEVLELKPNLVASALTYQFAQHRRKLGLNREVVRVPGRRAHFVWWLGKEAS